MAYRQAARCQMSGSRPRRRVGRRSAPHQRLRNRALHARHTDPSPPADRHVIQPSLPLDACGKDGSPELLPTGEVLAEELGICRWHWPRPTTSPSNCAASWPCGTSTASTPADTSFKHTLTTWAKLGVVYSVGLWLHRGAEGRQVAVFPDTGTAEHPAMAVPLSVKLTVPPPGAGLMVAV